ncbi:MAG: undecaprenyl-phosphate glucose phosphotransferase [Deltaproteobacteria bacterium]|nr:undecaprenyl-phosphate glucose phosphotransferase [Deltaproteobacteria bacterium]
MLKKHAQFFKSLFFISDLVALSLAWVLSYYLRFYTNLISPPILGTPPLSTYLEFVLPLCLIWGWVSKKIHLYRPRRISHLLHETFDIVKSLSFALIILIGIIYLLRRFEFSRLAFLYFWAIALFGLMIIRILYRKTLKILRKRGYNQRYALIAGTGLLGKKILEKVELHPEMGIQVIGYLTRNQEEVGQRVSNIPVLGAYRDLEHILKEKKPDIFFIALPIYEYDHLGDIINELRGHSADIKVIPGAYEFLGLRGGVDELDGLPIVSLQSSPLYGWNSVFKRAFDLGFGSLILAMASPLMALIALLIKLTSKGPVLYRQERVGMDGHTFEMLKFRTMRVDAEKETGPVWVKENDPRRTKMGAFLRKTSLDELPQLINVIQGEMSLVGPRPERPFFVEEFKIKVPFYMLRHKIKAGITGWAQVNGLRGNTSLEKRIEYDLYYIQNWSIGFDLKILLMTLWKGFFNKSAH